MISYFSLKIINFGIISFLGDPAVSVRYGAVMQVLEFFILGATLFIFRSRVWPPFYSLGLSEINVSYCVFINELEPVG